MSLIKIILSSLLFSTSFVSSIFFNKQPLPSPLPSLPSFQVSLKLSLPIRRTIDNNITSNESLYFNIDDMIIINYMLK
jgi:hypothetical protein